MAHPWIGKIKLDKILKRQLEPPYIPDLSIFNFDLQDIKSNLEDINILLDADQRTKKFDACFSGDFCYTNQNDMNYFVDRLAPIKIQHKNNKPGSDSKEKRNCLSLRSRTCKHHTISSVEKRNKLINHKKQEPLSENNRSLDCFCKYPN